MTPPARIIRFILNYRDDRGQDIYSVSTPNPDKVLEFLRERGDPIEHLTLIPMPEGQPIHDVEVYDYLKGKKS